MSSVKGDFNSPNATIAGPRFIVVMGRATPNPSDTQAGDGLAEIAHLLRSHGGRLRINATEPLRIYEYVLHLPRAMIVAEWPGAAEVAAFIRSPAMERLATAALHAECSVALFGPASDWDATLPGVWMENDRPEIGCDDPLHHVTFSEPAGTGETPLAKAAWDALDVYHRWGGVPLTNRTPLEVLAGDWPVGRNLLITRWPCREAFEAWYLDDPYQFGIKPNRLANGRHTLAHYAAVR